MSFDAWFFGVVSGISAPADLINADTLWAWSGAESLPRDRMSINNPLNTTQYEPGAVPFNTLPSGAHVWKYASVTDGIKATCDTLLNGHYPRIVSHLRGSVNRTAWSDACTELGVWGTGCAWIYRDYGVLPSSLEDELSYTDADRLRDNIASTSLFGQNKPVLTPSLYDKVTALQNAVVGVLAAVNALAVATGGLTAEQATELQEIHDRVIKDLA